MKIKILNHFFYENGIEHNFSSYRTPQQNGVIERKNTSLEEIARTLLNDTNLLKYIWAKPVNTACYIMNRDLIRPILKKTPNELYKQKKTEHFSSSCVWMQVFYAKQRQRQLR